MRPSEGSAPAWDICRPRCGAAVRGLCWSETACGRGACLSQKHWDQNGSMDLMATGASCLTGRQAKVCEYSAHALLLCGPAVSFVAPWLAVHVLLLTGTRLGFRMTATQKMHRQACPQLGRLQQEPPSLHGFML